MCFFQEIGIDVVREDLENQFMHMCMSDSSLVGTELQN